MNDVDKTPFSKEELRNYLDQLLRTNREGDEYAEMFWEFVGALAWGRGIVERIDSAGKEAADKVPKSPTASFDGRQSRAYHIGALSRLLIDIEQRVLPNQFKVNPIVNDLMLIADLSVSGSKGKPDILRKDIPPKPELDGNKIAIAKQRIILGIRYQMGLTGKTLAALRDEFDPPLDKSTEEGWRRASSVWQSSDERKVQIKEALEQGRAGRQSGTTSNRNLRYSDWNEIRGELYEIALRSQGVRRQR